MAINNFKMSAAGLALLKAFEGLRLMAYKDIAGVWTIGYGSTYYANGNHIKEGDDLLTVECAEDLLRVTLIAFERTVNRVVTVPLNQNRFDALVCFHFNTGALVSSTLLRKLNNNEIAGAALEFLKWTKITDPATGKKIISDTLTKRRAKEQKLFLTPIAA